MAQSTPHLWVWGFALPFIVRDMQNAERKYNKLAQNNITIGWYASSDLHQHRGTEESQCQPANGTL